LFYGPPGNGKTSSISAIAGRLKLNLYSLNLSDSHIDDAQLASLVRSVRPRSILLLEDVDAALHTREEIKDDKKKAESKQARDKGVTLSGVLNVLDGIVTPFGMLVMMTTNYPERLDAALVRPGRIDKKIEFTNATFEQKVASHLWFYPERGEQAACEFAQSMPDNVSMATVQEALIALKEPKEPKEPEAKPAPDKVVAIDDYALVQGNQ
jgi:mitochondrial chaperone BCS1